ncbi:hypothetical protein ACRAWF_12345 [Streptomyces sp. L7]
MIAITGRRAPFFGQLSWASLEGVVERLLCAAPFPPERRAPNTRRSCTYLPGCAPAGTTCSPSTEDHGQLARRGRPPRAPEDVHPAAAVVSITTTAAPSGCSFRRLITAASFRDRRDDCRRCAVPSLPCTRACGTGRDEIRAGSVGPRGRPSGGCSRPTDALFTTAAADLAFQVDDPWTRSSPKLLGPLTSTSSSGWKAVWAVVGRIVGQPGPDQTADETGRLTVAPP